MNIFRDRQRLQCIITPLLIAGLCVSATASAEKQPTNMRFDALLSMDPRAMEFAPVAFNPPKPERITLNNGMIVYLLPDNELPLIHINAMVKTGDIYEPADKIGLAAITGTVMRTGGAGLRTGSEIDAALEFTATHIEVHIGSDSGSASLDVLKNHFDSALEMFADILRAPTFSQDKLDLAKKQAIETIRRRNDRPAEIASREFYKILYGEDHPYGRISTAKGIARITRDDLQAFHARYFHPNNIMLGITGDFEREMILTTLRNTFGNWPQSKVHFPHVPPVNPNRKGTVNRLAKDVTQTHLRIGHLSIRQDHPDFYALALLNDILGAGGKFGSRLFQDVRTRQGLAYSVGSMLRAGKRDLGSILLYAQTKSETTNQAITSMTHHLKRLREAPVNQDELNRAKDAFLNSFVFSFSSSSAVVRRLMSLEYYGLPPDFLERYRENVVKLTADDLLSAAQTHYHPDNLTIVAVGQAKTLDTLLPTFGPVRTIVLSDGE